MARELIQTAAKMRELTDYSSRREDIEKVGAEIREAAFLGKNCVYYKIENDKYMDFVSALQNLGYTVMIGMEYATSRTLRISW